MEKNQSSAITPEIQGEFLKKYAHLEGENVENVSLTIKYYTYTSIDGAPVCIGLRDAGFKVIEYDGKAIQVVKMGADEARLLGKNTKLQFGGF